uniref:Uncharacterized protein n=1 Tax=Tanacetum cinerariifolium TaxID=118510 RepID=A0A6L2KKB5_TANCI|nr:hypothetical protein [Tanacetum cinerariifolium]
MEDLEQAFVEYASSHTDEVGGALPSDTVKNPKLSTSLVLSAHSYPTEEPQCSTHIHGLINTIMIHPKQQNNSRDSMAEEEEKEREGDPKDTNTIAYIEEPLDLVDTSKESVYESLIKEMPICSFNYDQRNLKIPHMIDFTILKNIKTNIDPSLSHVIFGRPFIEIAYLAINRKHGLMTFIDVTKEITFKTPYKDPERSELSRKGHDLLSSRVILSKDDYDRGYRKPSDLEEGFYRDTIKLEPEYVTRMNDEGEVTSMQTVAEDGIASIKQRRRDLSSDDVRNMVTTLERGRLKEDLESSTWRRRHDGIATPSRRKEKKETKAFTFYRMETEEVSKRYIAPCFMNGLEAYDSKINLEHDKNLISNEFTVKLCLEHEVKDGDKVVKKELIVALRGEIYFMKFIINPEEDDIEPGVILGRSFMRLTKAQTSVNIVESDSDNEEKYIIKRNSFGASIYGPKSLKYLNCNDLIDRVLALQEEARRTFSVLKRREERFTLTSQFIPSFATYDFDEVCADDELRTKKLIKFRLCGRPHSLTLLEFTRNLGATLVEKPCFNYLKLYFASATKDDHLWIMPKDDWLITKMAKKIRLLTDKVLNSLSAPTYCRALDTTTLRELIDSEGRLILKDPAPGVLCVAIPRVLRPSMHDLYDWMGSMEIRQGAIDRMAYRQSYHWDRYAGVYDVLLQGAYDPPDYDQQQYQQYYQQ